MPFLSITSSCLGWTTVFLLFTGFAWSSLAGRCDEAITALHPGFIKRWLASMSGRPAHGAGGLRGLHTLLVQPLAPLIHRISDLLVTFSRSAVVKLRSLWGIDAARRSLPRDHEARELRQSR